MSFRDLISMCLRNLWRRKLRSVLTILGVFIGTTAVLLMLSIGFGHRKSLMETLGSEGQLTEITLYKNYWINENGQVEGAPNVQPLTDEAVETIRYLPNVADVWPHLRVQAFAKQGVYEGHFGVTGIPEAELQAKNIEFIEGGLDPEADVPIYVGIDVMRHNFYNPNSRGDMYMDYDPFAEPKVDLYNKDFFVIWDMNAHFASQDPASGVSKPKRYPLRAAGIMGKEITPDMTEEEMMQAWTRNDYEVYAPLEKLQPYLKQVFRGKALPDQPRRKNGMSTGEIHYDQIIVKAASFDKTLELFHNLQDMGYEANSAVEFIGQMEEQMKQSQMVLGAIGGISLLVAAIGIANTMMMSIYERTKEIGVYKVLGCRLKDIRNIFLGEAAFIGLFGGILGTGFSLLGSFILNKYGGMLGGMLGGFGGPDSTISFIPPYLIPVAILFACAIGMVSGLMPARRAMNLSALEALRNE